MIGIRPHNLDLGWDPASPLNMVLVQPRFEVESSGPSVARVQAGWRPNQEALVTSVVEFIKHRHERAPSDHRPIHAVMLPEFSVPRSSVPDLLKAVSEADDGILVVAGVEGQAVQEYRALLQSHSSCEAWRTEDMGALPTADGAASSWVNAMLIAWRDASGHYCATFQRKINPRSHLESAPRVIMKQASTTKAR